MTSEAKPEIKPEIKPETRSETISGTGSATPRAEGATHPRLGRFLRSKKGLCAVYLIFAGAYLGASGGRLRHHSLYNHYVYLAEGGLH